MPKKKEQKIYNTALYIRLSKADERKGRERFSESIENQKIILHEHLDAHSDEFKFYKEYIDDGVSGTDDIARPQFMEMIKDIKAGIIDCVIVKDLSRFARNYLQAGDYIQNVFQEYQTRFIALFDNVDTQRDGAYDTETVFKNVMNEDYSRRLSKNLIATFKIRGEKGHFLGAFPSYGYIRDPENKNHLIVDENVRYVIEFIFGEFLNGTGKNTIAKKLNDLEIVCPSVYKQQQGTNYQNYKKLESTNSWTYSTVQRILKNPVYCGDLVQHKTNHSKFKPKRMPTQYNPEDWILAKDCHEAIIDKETFNKVQEQLKMSTRDIDFTQNVSIFAGHLKCGECKRAMAKIQTKYKGNISTRYVCRSYKSNGDNKKICTAHSINENVLTEHILCKLNEQLKKYKDLDKAINERKHQQIKTKTSGIELHIAEIKSKIKSLETDNKGLNISLARLWEHPERQREREDIQAIIDENYKEIYKLEEELKKGEEKLAKDPKQALNNPVVKILIKHKKFTELNKEIMDSFVSTIFVYEKIITNSETGKKESKLTVETLFKFDKLE
ncbi:MAG: recombinase family protein [Acutalibacteraceae bacterium]|nr:recombinase family protein [Acutalibacteraceae bacterium]